MAPDRACGAVLRDGRIALVRRVDGRGDPWTLPGGDVEAGEGPARTAQRQVWLETGLRVEAVRFLCWLTNAGPGRTLCFLMSSPPAGQELLREARWFDLAQPAGDDRVRRLRPHLAGGADWAGAAADLADLYRRIDAEAGRLSALHATRLQCRRGCSSCCVDGVTVAQVEAEAIRRDHPQLLLDGQPHPPGMCAFLDGDGACRIYASRPYVCRTQGLPLRWIDQDDDGAFVELRDICPLNEEGEAIEGLDGDACWSIGWVEPALAQLQGRIDGGRLRRVALRDLFQPAPAGDPA